MTPAEAMQKIEGLRFSALTNLASDFRTFLRIVGEQPEVRSLFEAMTSENVTTEVLGRVLELAECPVEGDYEHPADAALAAYLWLLSLKASHLSEIAAQTVLECRQCWWSRKVAERVRKASRFHSHAGLVSSVLPAGGSTVDFTAHSRQADVVTVPMWTLTAARCEAVPAGGAIVVYPVREGDINALFRSHEAGRLNKTVLVGD